MGTLHYVVQTAPSVLWNGAALAVRPSAGPDFSNHYRAIKKKDYTAFSLVAPTFRISNANVDSVLMRDHTRTSSYLVIRSGGKWGYAEDLVRVLEHTAGWLEDTTFFVFSELEDCLDRYSIQGGSVEIDALPTHGDDVRPRFREILGDDPEKLATFEVGYLEHTFDEALWDDELITAYRPDVERLQAAYPDDWRVHYLAGRFAQATAEPNLALQALRMATELRPGMETKRWSPSSDTYGLLEDHDQTKGAFLRDVHMRSGDALRRLGRDGDAEQAYRAAANLAGANAAAAWNRIASLQCASGRTEEALETLRYPVRHGNRNDLADALFLTACAVADRDRNRAARSLVAAIAIDRRKLEAAQTEDRLESLFADPRLRELLTNAVEDDG